jgi:glutaredoxin
MGRLFKCDYCEARPTTTHGVEFLCNRHYNILYGSKKIEGDYIDVPKPSKKEKELHEHYMIILQNHSFVDARKTKRIVKQFLKDVEEIKAINPIYR